MLFKKLKGALEQYQVSSKRIKECNKELRTQEEQ